MNLGTTNPLCVNLLIGDLDPRLVSRRIQYRFHAQPSSGPRRANQVDHRFQIPEGLPPPGQTDKREEPMLNPVPCSYQADNAPSHSFCRRTTFWRDTELFGLSIDDLDFERKEIHVRRSIWRGSIQTPKSARSEAVLPMPEALEHWRPC